MRTQRGMSLIEMLAALFISAFIGMMMCEIAVTQNLVALKTNNKLDSIVSARRFCTQFEKDVHNAAYFSNTNASEFTLRTPSMQNSPVTGLPGPSAPPADTIDYSIGPMQGKNNEYQLIRSVNSSNATVVVSGIVGPLVNGQTGPQIFRYYPASSTGTLPYSLSPDTASGVRLTLELVGGTSSRNDISSNTYSFSSDVFPRTNFRTEMP